MIGSRQSVLKEEQLVKVIQKLSYELSQKEDMIRAMRWLVDLKSEKQARNGSYDK